MSLDGAIFVVAIVGVVMGIGSVWNAEQELRECWAENVNGATHLSAVALAVKAVLTVIAQTCLAVHTVELAHDPVLQVEPAEAIAVIALTTKAIYDYLFHMRLYAMIRPAAPNPGRRKMD